MDNVFQVKINVIKNNKRILQSFVQKENLYVQMVHVYKKYLNVTYKMDVLKKLQQNVHQDFVLTLLLLHVI